MSAALHADGSIDQSVALLHGCDAPRDEVRPLTDSILVLLLITVPDGYALGSASALLAASFHRALLTAHARLLRPLIRTCTAAICSGLASWVWLCESLSASGVHGLVGALVMAALSTGSPRPAAKPLMMQE